MKIKILAILTFSFIIAPFVFAKQTEKITDFNVTIDVLENSEIIVTEEISYDFSDNERHGIFRNIPYQYNGRGGVFELRINDLEVFNANGKDESFSLSRQNGVMQIKIGQADVLVTGPKKYIIKYRVGRALNYFEDYDELYWNVTGNDWDVEIAQSKLTVNFPASSDEKKTKTECFSGAPDSRVACVSKRFIYSAKAQVESVVLIDDKLLPGQGFTAVVGWEKGLVEKPTYVTQISETVRDNLILGLPLLTFIIMFYLWHNFGRDQGGKRTIIAEYEAPDNLTPAELGTIIDETADNKDISAEIIYLAVQGYLRIIQEEKKGIFGGLEYKLEKLKEIDDNLEKHEKMLVESIFQEKFVEKNDQGNEVVLLSALKKKFASELQKIRKQIYQSVVDNGYFKTSPQKVRGLYTTLGVVAMIGAWFMGPVFDWLGVVAIASSGLVVLIFGFIMPKKNVKGTRAKEKILGLKEYLRIAEKDRIDFHNAPEKKPEIFEKLLPFAIVLGVENEWAKQFEGIYVKNPDWYSSSSLQTFSAVNLANAVSTLSSETNSVMTSTASSGGSGFSGGGAGGGFGGGGGGSW